MLEVQAHQRDWNGATIWVEGWRDGCGGYDCNLFASASDARFDWRNVKAGDPFPEMLGIASDRSDLDTKLNQIGLKHILLKARLDDQCAGHMCTDRVPDLHPITFKVLPGSQPTRN